MKKNALLMGTTNLCIECGNHLISLQWNIVGVITNDVVVINWAKSKKITILESLDNLAFETQSCCLFSIINLSIIKINTLDFYLAINYHDSPLPRYAGVNSTTWAILNQEKFHGITWHKIAEGIDTGEVLIQEQIPILPNETAISLNLKCSEGAYYSFIKLINLIESNQLNPIAQNLSLRTYLGLSYLPDNYGIIQNGDSLENIERMARALYFSAEYDNSVASLKCFVQNTPYIIEFRSLAGSGRIDDVANKLIRNIYGDELDITICLDEIGSVILNEEELAICSKLKRNELRLKDYFIQQISQLDHHSNLLSVNLINPQNTQYINFSLADYLPAHENMCAFCYTMIQFVLAKLAMNPFFITSYGSSNSTSQSIQQLTYQLSILAITPDLLVNTWDELFAINVINSTQTKFVAKDFIFRFNLNLNSDIAIIQDSELNYDRLNHGVMFILSSSGIGIKYAADNKNIIEKFNYCFNVVLDKLRNQQIQGIPLQDNYLISSTDYQRIVYDWNNNWSTVNHETIQALFESQVIKTPHNIALVHQGTKISFVELNAKINQYANYLKTTFDISNNDLIVICLNRSIDMVVAMLAVIKAGGAYVPIDPNFPPDRMTYILLDTKSKVVITSEIYSSKFYNLLGANNQVNQNSTCIDLIDNAQTKLAILKFSNENFVDDVVSTDLAYVIYTSGTTGSPKGVMVEHGNLNNEINSQLKFLNFVNENSLLTASYVFDAAAECIYMSLYSGGTLHIIDYEDLLNVEKIINYIDLNKISVINTTPSYFLNLAGYPFVIKYLILGGEEFRQLPSHSIGLILNTYGPTETTIISTRYVVSDVHTSLIGKPIDNTSVYVLDKNLMPLPVGCIGDLYVGGAGVTRGYLNLPMLTQEKFIPNPFQSVQHASQNINSIIYKTGDLVRYDNDGNLEYIGRNDFQIKINGFRIELGEIENQLLRISQIKQACVVVKTRVETDQQYLAAYYVLAKEPNDGECVTQEHIFDKLGLVLPEYMLPSVIMELNSLPLTINGKLDRQALPDIEFKHTRNYVAPKSELENRVAQIWCEILSLNQVGLHDNFFKLGGHSLNSIQLVTRIRQELNLDLRVADIFVKPTIAKLLTNAQSIIQELDNCYFIGSSIQTQESMTIVCIPGFLKEFELTYIELVNELHKHNANATIYALKTNFYEFSDVVGLANYYINQLEKLNILNHKIILCGYSAGGVIAYFMAQQLPQTIKKLILFDTYFYAGSNYYQKVKNLMRAKLNLKINISAYSAWKYNLPIINTPILYFHATNDQMRDQYKLSRKIKFYYLRQMKANLEYYIFKFCRQFKLPNGLRRQMNIKKIHSLNAIHYGANGILTAKYLPEIVQIIQDDIKDI